MKHMKSDNRRNNSKYIVAILFFIFQKDMIL